MTQPQTATGHGIGPAGMPEQQAGVSEEQFLINHLTQRCAEIVADYEQKMAVGSLQVQVLKQQLDGASAQIDSVNQQLTVANNRVAELEDLVSTLTPQAPADAGDPPKPEDDSDDVRDDKPTD